MQDVCTGSRADFHSYSAPIASMQFQALRRPAPSFTGKLRAWHNASHRWLRCYARLYPCSAPTKTPRRRLCSPVRLTTLKFHRLSCAISTRLGQHRAGSEQRRCSAGTEKALRASWIAPPNRGSLNSAHIHGTHVPGGGAVHSIKSAHSVAAQDRSLWAVSNISYCKKTDLFAIGPTRSQSQTSNLKCLNARLSRLARRKKQRPIDGREPRHPEATFMMKSRAWFGDPE